MVSISLYSCVISTEKQRDVKRAGRGGRGLGPNERGVLQDSDGRNRGAPGGGGRGGRAGVSIYGGRSRTQRGTLLKRRLPGVPVPEGGPAFVSEVFIVLTNAPIKTHIVKKAMHLQVFIHLCKYRHVFRLFLHFSLVLHHRISGCTKRFHVFTGKQGKLTQENCSSSAARMTSVEW